MMDSDLPFAELDLAPPRAQPYVMQYISRSIDQFSLNPFVPWRVVSFYCLTTDVTSLMYSYLSDHSLTFMLVRFLRFYDESGKGFDALLLEPPNTPELLVELISKHAYGRPDQFTAEMM